MPNGTYGGVRGKETKIGRKKKKTSFPYLLDCYNLRIFAKGKNNVYGFKSTYT